jgi:alpha-D-ribose 1-methylphosphonate 5-triphosphate diphosphatase
LLPPLNIVGARIATPSGIVRSTPLGIGDGRIAAVGSRLTGSPDWDAAGLLAMPGIVDLHGDAFERQMMPRPGVHFDVRLALRDTDRQLVANGITTAFHAITYSWEPGLRSCAAGRALIAALGEMRPTLACDTRVHLRWEAYNLDVQDEIIGWLEGGRVDLLAFNDHTPELLRHESSPTELQKYAERGGVSVEAFRSLLLNVAARADQVPDAVARLAAAARRCNVPMAAHDEATPEQRRAFRDLGCRISEFPKNRPTAAVAHADGHDVVMGAPNVVRGGSHLSSVSAAELVAEGVCTILASDYYYPALLHAAFRLARTGVCSLHDAWRLIAETPARAAGLNDRGTIAVGQRADLVLVDDSVPDLPRVAATLVAGRLIYSDGSTVPVLDKQLADAR